jgi:hypothetical protein
MHAVQTACMLTDTSSQQAAPVPCTVVFTLCWCGLQRGLAGSLGQLTLLVASLVSVLFFVHLGVLCDKVWGVWHVLFIATLMQHCSSLSAWLCVVGLWLVAAPAQPLWLHHRGACWVETSNHMCTRSAEVRIRDVVESLRLVLIKHIGPDRLLVLLCLCRTPQQLQADVQAALTRSPYGVMCEKCNSLCEQVS